MAEPTDPDATQRATESDIDATQRVVRAEPLLAPGKRVFGRFTLDAVLGRGGMSVVWSALDDVLRERVALKFLPSVVANDDVAIDELKEETRRARRLTHPHIVRIHDFMHDAGAEIAAIAMELVEGATLSKLRLQQPGKVFSPETFLPIVSQICDALEYAHTQPKVAHRDLKPANILITSDGLVKIADFGIARSLSETQTRLTSTTRASTSGTLLYMSPQQLRGLRPSAADDIYALGATLYEALASKPPFYSGELTTQVLHELPEPLNERRAAFAPEAPPVPPEWAAAIHACLEKDPTRRPASARGVFQLLSARTEPISTAPPLAPAMPASRPPAPAPSSDPGVTTPARAPAPRTVSDLLAAAPEPAVAPAASPRPPAPKWTGWGWAFVGAVCVLPIAFVAYKATRTPNASTSSTSALPTITAPAVQTAPSPTATSTGGAEARPPARHGSLKLSATPPGATFTLKPHTSGMIGSSGQLPATLEELAVGDYRLTVSHPLLESVSEEIVITPGVALSRQYPLPFGGLTAAAEPVEAEVWNGDTLLGKTPLQLPVMRPGPVALTFKRSGFAPELRAGTIAAGSTLNLVVTFPAPVAFSAPVLQPVAREEDSTRSRPKLLDALSVQIGQLSLPEDRTTEALFLAALLAGLSSDQLAQLPYRALTERAMADALQVADRGLRARLQLRLVDAMARVDVPTAQRWAANALATLREIPSAPPTASFSLTDLRGFWISPDLGLRALAHVEQWYKGDTNAFRIIDIAGAYERFGRSEEAVRLTRAYTDEFYKRSAADTLRAARDERIVDPVILALYRSDMSAARNQLARIKEPLLIASASRMAGQFARSGNAETAREIVRLVDLKIPDALEGIRISRDLRLGRMESAEQRIAKLPVAADRTNIYNLWLAVAEEHLQRGDREATRNALARLKASGQKNNYSFSREVAIWCWLGDLAAARARVAEVKEPAAPPPQSAIRLSSLEVSEYARAAILLRDEPKLQRMLALLTGDAPWLNSTYSQASGLLARIGRVEEAQAMRLKVTDATRMRAAALVCATEQARGAKPSDYSAIVSSYSPGAPRLGALLAILQLSLQPDRVEVDW